MVFFRLLVNNGNYNWKYIQILRLNIASSIKMELYKEVQNIIKKILS